ncbi:MAG: hypothetical protein HFG24_12105 [Anaerotruncus sp.]|nr:hypothetical protein [Anaerotruncus sp.]
MEMKTIHTMHISLGFWILLIHYHFPDDPTADISQNILSLKRDHMDFTTVITLNRQAFRCQFNRGNDFCLALEAVIPKGLQNGVYADFLSQQAIQNCTPLAVPSLPGKLTFAERAFF